MRSNEHFKEMQPVVIVSSFQTRLNVLCDPFFHILDSLVNSTQELDG